MKNIFLQQILAPAGTKQQDPYSNNFCTFLSDPITFKIPLPWQGMPFLPYKTTHFRVCIRQHHRILGTCIILYKTTSARSRYMVDVVLTPCIPSPKSTFDILGNSVPEIKDTSSRSLNKGNIIQRGRIGIHTFNFGHPLIQDNGISDGGV